MNMNVPSRASGSGEIESVMTRARDLLPFIRERAERGEQERRMPEESLQALAEAGLFKLSQPRRYGGLESSVREAIDASAIIGEADGGTSWTVAILNFCAWLGGLFTERAQNDIWRATPDALVCGVFAPSAESVKEKDGYTVSGKWYYNSGSWHATWFLLGVPIVDESGRIVNQGLALVPRADLEHEETWFVAGMSSTGSNSVSASGIFIPEYRILSVTAAIEGRYATEHREEVLYRTALAPLLSLALTGPQLGMGRAALKLVLEKSEKKPISYTYYETQAQSTAFQMQIAEAAILIDTAHLHVHRAAADLDSAAMQNVLAGYLTRARVRADAGYAIDKVTKAIDILLYAHGAGSFAQVNPLQRIWRDSAVGARHAFAVPAVGLEIYGKALLDCEDQITPFV